MTSPIDEFIADARAVSIEEAAKILGLDMKRRQGVHEYPQPCPQCRGKDTFSFNTSKNVWNCRKGGVGGHDAIGMVAHCRDYDVRRREDFMEVCSILTGRDIPVGGERESDEDRQARQDRLEEKRRQAEADAAKAEADARNFRDRERQKARGIYEAAASLAASSLPYGRFYLERRGCGVPDRYLRIAADVPYWHGKDDIGRNIALHSGPAMVAPFIDGSRQLIGCHITWIDLDAPPKFRPILFAPAEGRKPDRASGGQPAQPEGQPPFGGGTAREAMQLPTKKMRGSKKGGLIPLAGSWKARRWVGGEGIENGLAFARWEGFRDDSFYFAAGDLGNLAGPADPASRFAHPSLTRPDRRGFARPVMVQGSAPLASAGGNDCIPVAGHVAELVLLGDGDSEPVMTAAAMARARKRHGRDGRAIFVYWPRRGSDFSSMAVAYDREEEHA